MVDCGVSSCGPGQKTTCCCSQNGTSLFCERSTAVHAPPEHDEPDKQPKLKCGGLCTVAPERSNTWFKLVQKASRTKPWFSYGTAVGALPPARPVPTQVYFFKLSPRNMRIGWVLGLGPHLRVPAELQDFRKPSHSQGCKSFLNFVEPHTR